MRGGRRKKGEGGGTSGAIGDKTKFSYKLKKILDHSFGCFFHIALKMIMTRRRRRRKNEKAKKKEKGNKKGKNKE